MANLYPHVGVHLYHVSERIPVMGQFERADPYALAFMLKELDKLDSPDLNLFYDWVHGKVPSATPDDVIWWIRNAKAK